MSALRTDYVPINRGGIPGTVGGNTGTYHVDTVQNIEKLIGIPRQSVLGAAPASPGPHVFINDTASPDMLMIWDQSATAYIGIPILSGGQVQEFANVASFPATGSSNKIYIAGNTGLLYRWTGAVYSLAGDGVGGGVSDGDKGQIVVSGAGTAWNLDTGAAIANIGYTPVQQGTGFGQSANQVKVGWGGAQLLLTIDTTDFGASWPINTTGTSGGLSALNAAGAQIAVNAIQAAPAVLADLHSTLPVFVGSGASHAPGIVPDPGAVAGTTRYLREDGTWVTPPAGGGGLTDGDMGDIIVGGTGTTLTIDANVVNNAKASDMAAFAFKMRNAAASGDPQDVTAVALTANATPPTSRLIMTFDPATGEPQKSTLAQAGVGSASAIVWNGVSNPPAIGSIFFAGMSPTVFTSVAAGGSFTPSGAPNNQLTIIGGSTTVTITSGTYRSIGFINDSVEGPHGLWLRVS